MSLSGPFVSQARARSSENAAAFSCLYERGLYGVCIGLLRQELDTLLRASYLWHEDTDPEEARRLFRMSADGEQWTTLSPKGRPIRLTDKEMLDVASHLGGWEQLVYVVGCRLIHLSSSHLYRVNDPMAALEAHDRAKITSYLREFHGASSPELSFEDVVRLLPSVMQKLVSNVNFYLGELKERYG